MYGSSPVELLAANAMLQGLIYCESFTYSAAWITGTASALGANATVDQQIQINSDSDFVVQEWNFVSWSAADTIIGMPDYLLNVVMAGSGRQIFDRPQDIAVQCGAFTLNKQPGRIPFPRLLQANNTITTTLQNRTGTASNRALLAFRGFKVFYMGSDRQQIFHAL